jgi:hypothetical protein
LPNKGDKSGVNSAAKMSLAPNVNKLVLQPSVHQHQLIKNAQQGNANTIAQIVSHCGSFAAPPLSFRITEL